MARTGLGSRDALLRRRPLETGRATFAASGLNHVKSGRSAQPHSAGSTITSSGGYGLASGLSPVQFERAQPTEVV
jgi:hypothetical protein